MEIDEILAVEQKNRDRIYLYKIDGKWHAYDYSAFWVTKLIPVFTPVCRIPKEGKEYAYVHIPLGSVTMLRHKLSFTEDLPNVIIIDMVQPFGDSEFRAWRDGLMQVPEQRQESAVNR